MPVKQFFVNTSVGLMEGCGNPDLEMCPQFSRGPVINSFALNDNAVKIEQNGSGQRKRQFLRFVIRLSGEIFVFFSHRQRLPNLDFWGLEASLQSD